ncbi:hypothetical protein BC332_20678 [Capsicum chinense]|nr:hypothetical protein BC332_20678 [Capsicum chinense]
MFEIRFSDFETRMMLVSEQTKIGHKESLGGFQKKTRIEWDVWAFMVWDVRHGKALVRVVRNLVSKNGSWFQGVSEIASGRVLFMDFKNCARTCEESVSASECIDSSVSFDSDEIVLLSLRFMIIVRVHAYDKESCTLLVPSIMSFQFVQQSESLFKIPIGFLKYLKGQEHVKCGALKRDGKKWRVKVNGRKLEEGNWGKFVEEFDLQVGNILVFSHEGNMEFEVSIFDSSQCSREYAEYMQEDVVEDEMDVDKEEEEEHEYEVEEEEEYEYEEDEEEEEEEEVATHDKPCEKSHFEYA